MRAAIIMKLGRKVLGTFWWAYVYFANQKKTPYYYN